MAKLKVAGTWSGAIEVELEVWTVPMLREEVARRSGLSPDSINLICGGKVLKDADAAAKLSELGVRSNAKILATRVCVDEGKSLKEEALAEDERSRRLARVKAAATALAKRHADGSLPLEDFNLELEDQSGKKVNMGSETDQRAVMMGLMLHSNAKQLIKRQKYEDALEVLAMGEESFSLCNPQFIEMVDNVPILQIDMVWCYFMLRDISSLSVAGIRLQKAREGIERAHGKDYSRVRLLQGGRYPEIALHLRLELLEGVVAYHSGHLDKSRKALTSAQEKFFKGDNRPFDLPAKEKTDICTIMYTSGTTGDPKGVMISNESIVTLIAGVKRLLKSVNEELHSEDVYMSYLPLAHIFDRVIEECFIHHGASIGFWRGDVKLLIEDIGELKPTIFCAVPRVLDRVYSGLTQKISAGGFLRHTLFNLAYSYKLNNLKKGTKYGEAAPLFDRFVFNKVKQGLGGNVRLILSGAAPLSNHVEAFLRVVTCAHVLQGYGLTETCAGTFVSLPNEHSMLGTVGPPVPNVDVCLESVPEMGYDALSSTPRGEVCVRGKTLFSGYYKREDLTREVMVDGWFHTGDVGEWQPDGSLKIIDRKKNIFKLSQGEYVAVENLENIYGLVSAIDSIWIYGNSFESFLVAVVNPNKEALEKWAQENEVSGDFNSLCENPKAKEFLIGELTKTGKEKKLKGFEFIKAVHLDPMPFDMDRDLLTPTYKKKRPQMQKYYQGVIDNMYKSANKRSS